MPEVGVLVSCWLAEVRLGALEGEKGHTMVLADWGVPSSRLVVALTGPSFCEVGVYVWEGPSIGVCIRGKPPGACSGKADGLLLLQDQGTLAYH